MTKKKFCLEALREYIQDSSRCGYEDGGCMYLTGEGKKCVAGKYFLSTFKEYGKLAISSILLGYPQEKVFIPEAVGILTSTEWQSLQKIHDAIAINSNHIEYWVGELGLFTYEELIALKN